MTQKDKITVKPGVIRLVNLLEQLHTGELQVPVFQREFVWEPEDMKKLFDSITNGYPIGSLLFWKAKSEFEAKEEIGPFKVKKGNGDIKYVLDGFQRITTLFSSLINPEEYEIKLNDEERNNFRKEWEQAAIYYDLKNDTFNLIKNRQLKWYMMPLYKAIEVYEFLRFSEKIVEEIENKNEIKRYVEKARKLSTILIEYKLPFIEIRGGDIENAAEIFNRINYAGKNVA